MNVRYSCWFILILASCTCCAVTINDFAHEWLAVDSYCDFNEDGVVNYLDFSLIEFTNMGTKITFGTIWDMHRTTLSPAAYHSYGDTNSQPWAEPGWRLPANAEQSIDLAVARFNDYDDLGTPVDLTIWGGDLINGGMGGVGEQRALNFAALVGDLAPLTPSSHLLQGHWDYNQSYTEADYTQFFDDDTGVGTLIPTGDEVPVMPWWPLVAPDDSECAYAIEMNGFKLIFLCALMNEVGLNTTGESDDLGDAAEITQLDWLEKRLDEAVAASQPAVIFSHQSFVTTHFLTDGVLAKILGFQSGIDLLAEEKYDVIDKYILAGHIHINDEIIIVGSTTHINLKGDVHGLTEDDTDRYSHSVITILKDAVWNGTRLATNIEITGYGYQNTEDYTKYFVGGN